MIVVTDVPRHRPRARALRPALLREIRDRDSHTMAKPEGSQPLEQPCACGVTALSPHRDTSASGDRAKGHGQTAGRRKHSFTK